MRIMEKRQKTYAWVFNCAKCDLSVVLVTKGNSKPVRRALAEAYIIHKPCF